mgnify:CR=1 FL=1
MQVQEWGRSIFQSVRLWFEQNMRSGVAGYWCLFEGWEAV